MNMSSVGFRLLKLLLTAIGVPIRTHTLLIIQPIDECID